MDTLSTTFLFFTAALAGLALLLLGTRQLSEGLQIIIGDNIRSTMSRLGESQWNSLAVGATTSLMIQSRISAAVMAVSYTGSGLMNLRQFTLFLTGTAMGTVVTPWIFVLETGRIDLFLLALGVLPMLYAKWDSFAGLGRVIFAFGLMLLGFDIIAFGAGDPDSLLLLMSSFVPVHTEMLASDVIRLTMTAFLLSFLFRSTVALLGLTMAFVFSGLMPVSAAIVLTIGFNLGATIVPLVTALRSNLVARRGATIYFNNHLMVTLVMLMSLPWLVPLVQSIANQIGSRAHAQSLMLSAVVCVPLIHLIFNACAICVSLLMRPINLKLIPWLLPQVGRKQPQHLLYLGRPSHLAPSLAIEQAHQEVKKLSALVHSMLGMTEDLFAEKQSSEDQRVRKYESITDKILQELTVFIAKVMQASLSKKQSFEATCLLQVAIELEKIANCCDEIIDFQNSKNISPEIRQELHAFFSTAVEAYDHIFPLITEQIRTNEKAMASFVRDMDQIILFSIKVYDSMLEKGLRQKQEYDMAIGAVNSIRRIVEGSKSIVDIRKRYLIPEEQLQ